MTGVKNLRDSIMLKKSALLVSLILCFEPRLLEQCFIVLWRQVRVFCPFETNFHSIWDDVTSNVPEAIYTTEYVSLFCPEKKMKNYH